MLNLKKKIETFLFGVFYVGLLVLLGGLVTYTSYAPRVFHKYSRPHFVLILVVFIVTMFWKGVWAFFRRESRWFGRVVTPRRKFLVAALLMLAAAGIGEAVLRARHPCAREVDPALLEKYHPYLQNDLRRGDRKLHVNADGFRGDELSPTNRPDVLIFMLGGSTMLSHDAPYAKSHAALLQARLREAFPGLNISVQNAANEWHTTIHSTIKYVTRVRGYKPDIVVMWHGMNDLCRSFGPNRFTMPGREYQDDYRHYLGPLANMVGYYAEPVPNPPLFNSLFASWLKSVLYADFRGRRARAEAEPVATAVEEFPSLESYRSNLDCLLRLVTADGVQVLMASEPSVYAAEMSAEVERSLWMNSSLCRFGDLYPDARSMAEGMSRFNAAAKDAAESRGVLFVDLDSRVPKTRDYMFDDCHYTEKGNELVAQEVASFVIEHGLIEESVRRKQGAR